jgi:hypothetical protein
MCKRIQLSGMSTFMIILSLIHINSHKSMLSDIYSFSLILIHGPKNARSWGTNKEGSYVCNAI